MFPIKLQVTNFLQLPNVLDNIIDTQRTLIRNHVDGTYRNILHGELWREVVEEYPDDLCIPFGVYEDDFNPDNALGPHKKSTNLAMFYIYFPTLPDYCRSSIKNIYPVMLAKAEDLRLSTNNTLLHFLEIFQEFEEGVDVRKNGEENSVKVRFIFLTFIGDNLALNMVLGYIRNFRGNGFCRVCIMPLERTQHALNEDGDLIRNADNYIEGANGIREESVLNALRFFKVYANFSADIMHDCYLGADKLDINEILKYLVLEEGIGVDEINDAITNFDWGRQNKHYVPAPFTEEAIVDNKIKLQAKEAWAFVDYLLFFLRNFIDVNNEIYIFATTVVDISDILLQSEISEEQINELERLMFGNLTPKMHFMTHYPRIIRLCGPLKHHWCFAMERKHQEIKRYTNVNKNRKNLCFSAAKKMSIQEAATFLNRKNIFTKISEISKDTISEYPHFHERLPNSQCVKFLKYCGQRYYIGDYIIHEDREFIFKILEIYVNTENEYVLY